MKTSDFYKYKIELDLSEKTILKAMKIYEKSIINDIKKENAVLIPACVYASCRGVYPSITLKMVSNISHIKRADLARCYRLLMRTFDLP